MNKIKQALKGIALLTVLVTASMMVGCGGGDDGGGGSPAPATNTNVPSATAVDNSTFALTASSGEQRTVKVANGRYTVIEGTNATESGTFTRSASANGYTFNVTPDDSTNSQVLVVNFTGTGTGTYTLTPSSGQPSSGTFSWMTDNGNNNPPPDGGNNGGTNNPPPGTNTNNNGGDTIPTALTGKQVQLSSSQGGEFLKMTTGSDFIGEIGNGTYTYSLAGNIATLNVNFTSPAEHAGEFYNLTLNYTSANAGTFSGNQHFEGTDHQVSGNFSLSPL